MVMMKSLVFSAVVVASSVADASTTVAVLEFGKKGCVHRTTTKNTDTTVSGVKSFWNALSGTGLQDPDMTVVPDLFKRPSGHVVLGITGSGVDLDSMPTVSKLVQSEGDKVAGQMTISGSHGRALLNKVGSAEELSVDSIIEGVKNSISADKLSALNVKVEDNASQVDSQIAAMLTALQEQAGDDSTFVVHLVVEEEEGAARRRLMARRLEDAQNNGNQQNDGQNAGDNNQNNKAGYYGYGYYNAYGEWVTPYKTMFQIQYFNVVLWTSIGLVVLLLFVIWLVIDMPLEADTLLFGESAKMMGE